MVSGVYVRHTQHTMLHFAGEIRRNVLDYIKNQAVKQLAVDDRYLIWLFMFLFVQLLIDFKDECVKWSYVDGSAVSFTQKKW